MNDISSALDLLAVVSKGKATITVGGRTLVRMDADEKVLEVDAEGAKQAGLHLLEFARQGGGTLAAVRGPLRIAGALSQNGWKLTVQSEGEKVLSMGKGTSRLTGRISMNPLKARKLMKALG